MGTVSIGNAMAFAPNFNKAMVAAAKIFGLLDRKPEIYDPLHSSKDSDWVSQNFLSQYLKCEWFQFMMSGVFMTIIQVITELQIVIN